MNMHWTRRALCAGLAATAFALPAVAQPDAPYPAKPIELIVAYGPGGGTDLVARLLARHLEKQIGGSVVVLNRPGAGGGIGFGELARAKPDGYTIGFINTPSLFLADASLAWKIGPGEVTVAASNLFDERYENISLAAGGFVPSLEEGRRLTLGYRLRLGR